jgi:hypothetical protein
MVDTEHIGGYCPNCGTLHRVIESIPARPLRMTEVESMRDSDNVVFCMGVMMMSGGLVGMDTEEDVTEDIVLATEVSTRLLSLYRDHGWVVEVEVEHEEDESAEEVAMDVYRDAATMSSDAMNEAFGGR